MKSPLPETITVYHTSPIENLESILRFGVTTAKFNFEEGLKIIRETKAPKWRKKSAEDRLLECFRDNPSGYICVSGNKGYSLQNGLACREFLESLGICKNGNYKNGHKRACFKIVLPTRILEILTAKNWQDIVARFEELWVKNYFARKSWEARYHIRRLKEIHANENLIDSWRDHFNAVKTYDHFYMAYIPPEYIESYEIIETEE